MDSAIERIRGSIEGCMMNNNSQNTRSAQTAPAFAASCAALMFTVVATATAGPTEMVLHSFAGDPNDGTGPVASLVADRAGNFYGTTVGGGEFGNGTVFKLTPTGMETVLYSFAGPPDGADPSAGLLADSTGNLYGTTAGGGEFGNGTVFKLTPTGTETVLYSFAGRPNDGASPNGGVVADHEGNLYGTTTSGGAGTAPFCPGGCGTVFKLKTTGTETILYFFAGISNGDGQIPRANLIADSAGNLYGTTYEGGNINCKYGCGTVFKLTPSGTETVLYSFLGPPNDGQYSMASLIADSTGNLYGTTYIGGAGTSPYCCGLGTVFKLTSTGFVTPAAALAALLKEVTGVGPGTSLASKVKVAQTYYSANDIPTTCSMLTAFVSEVNAQSGKKISQSFAGELVADAQSIQTAIGCGPQ